MKKLLIVLTAVVISVCGVLCLTACSGKKEYSVVCGDSENGYVIASDTGVAAGEKVILAAHPDAGYRLVSFVLDGEDIAGVSFVMPEKDVTVSARFELVTYSITYILGDATVSGDNPSTYTVESGDTLIEPKKDGYETCGWYRYRPEPEFGYDYDIEDYRVTSLEGVYGDLTLYAMYYNPWHTIDISNDSEHGYGFVGNSTGEAQYSDAIEVTVVPDNGYAFYLTVNGTELLEGETSFTMPACDVEIVIYYTPIEYKISYELDGGENSELNPQSYTVQDDEITLYDATKEGYIFDYWYYFDEYGYTQFVYDSTFRISSYDLCDITFHAYFIEDDEDDSETD